MKPLVNVDVPMSQDMLDALSIFEAFCVGSNIKTITIKDVTAFLSNHYGAELAAEFNPKFLY